METFGKFLKFDIVIILCKKFLNFWLIEKNYKQNFTALTFTLSNLKSSYAK